MRSFGEAAYYDCWLGLGKNATAKSSEVPHNISSLDVLSSVEHLKSTQYSKSANGKFPAQDICILTTRVCVSVVD